MRSIRVYRTIRNFTPSQVCGFYPLGEFSATKTFFLELCAQVGIHGLQFRDSRATALTLMARKMDILTLQKFSRHRDIRQLSIYYRETAEEISARL